MSGSPITFALLDRAQESDRPSHGSPEDYPLVAWYKAVRNTPLDELTVEDICKACRQNIHLDYIIPLALSTLSADVLAGEMYDGELLVALKSVPPEYWSRHDAEKHVFLAVARKVLASTIATSDVREDAQDIIRRL